MAQWTTEEWEKQVKSALQQWHDTAELNQHPLVELHIVKAQQQKGGYTQERFGRAKALREVLRAAIGLLGIEGVEPPVGDQDIKWMAAEWRSYNILHLLYIQALPRSVVQERIGMAEGGQYYRDQRRAINLLAHLLGEWEGQPRDEAPPLALSYPSGAVRLADHFYIQRQPDVALTHEWQRPGITVTIRGPRQVGKTSLLIRGIQEARQRYQARIIYFDLQSVGKDELQSIDAFLKTIAQWSFDELELDPEILEAGWRSQLPAQRKLTKLMARHVLDQAMPPVLLALDEIDLLLSTEYYLEFFGLLRSWHNRRAYEPQWNQLGLLMAISTEPYLLIKDINQSPFNVGLHLYLSDFSQEQVEELNQRYGRPLTREELPELLLLLNGHPFLTRVALYTIAQERLSWPVFVAQAKSDHGPFREHLEHQRQLIISDPALQQALQDVIQHNRCDNERASRRLLKAGLVKEAGKGYVCRCQLYQDYFSGRL